MVNSENQERERKFKPSLIIKFVVWFSKKIMWLVWPTKIFFKERYKVDGRAIITCNHYCSIDTNCIIRTFFKKKPYRAVVKEELMSGNGLVARYLDEVNAIPVKRGAADVHAVKKILKALKNDEQIIIYPEGTRNKSGSKEMLPLKDGTAMFAIKTKSQIVPMMHYLPNSWNKKNYFIVGNPFTLEKFYDDKSPDVKEKATEFIKEKYLELRKEIDEIVEVYKGNIKKYKKAHAME